MTEINGTWKPKFLRTFSFNPKKPLVDQARRKQLISESLWPTTLDREGYKAAAILRSFCRDGAYHDESRATTTETSRKPDIKREIKKIPAEIIRKAKGLVIFNILRAGLWEDGAGGSGVIVTRLKDDSWSTPAAIKLSTPEVGVVLGVDIFDCVLVLNTQDSINALKKAFCVIGGDLYSVTGPLDVGWFLEADEHARNAPIFSYFRSQQYYADVQAENFAFSARDEENRSFYSPQMLTLPDILAGKARSPPATINGLMECLKLVQGDADVNEAIITKQAPPSDFTMVEEGQAFAIPDVEDPDQYGYAALEKYGIVVVDAATKSPVAAEEFEFHPSIKSPAFEKYHRKGDLSSIDGRSSWRQSTLGSLDRHDTASVRSRNSILESSAPTSPPPVSPAVGQIQLEDNATEPTLNLTDRGRLYSSGKITETVGSAENDRPEGLTSRPISMKALVSPHTVTDQAIESEQVEAEEERLSKETGVLSHSQRDIDNVESFKSSVPARFAETADLPGVTNASAESPSTERSISPASEQSTPETPTKHDVEHEDDNDSSDNFEDLDEDFEIHDASASQPTTLQQSGVTAVSLSQAKVVTVPKAVAPSLPVRNPVRLTMLSPPTSQIALDDPTEALDESTTVAEASEVQQATDIQEPLHNDTAEQTLDRKSISSFQDEEAFTVRSRSISPVKADKHISTKPMVSLANMRQGLGSASPEQSPER